MNIRFYGYIQGRETAKALQLREVTLVANSQDLRIIAQFLDHVAGLIEQYGEDFGHEHLEHFTEVEKGAPSFVVIAPYEKKN